ncbi:MAG: hypothetical protein IPN34_02135 [Planctomycetes bacterium]|nr:hypothetical protein [Planctomycetota bacterium]
MQTEELMLRGLVLGLPLAILPGAFVDAAIYEARRNGFAATLALPLQRALIEVPLFLLLAVVVAKLPLGFLDHPAIYLAMGLVLALWGWFLIDRTSYLSLRMDASYVRLRGGESRAAFFGLLRRFPRSSWWWALWIPIAMRVAADLELDRAQFGSPAWWSRGALFAAAYYLPAAAMSWWFALALARRERAREGDFFLLPNRSYRIAVSTTGTLLLLLGGEYAVRVLGSYLDWPVLTP